MVSWRFLCDLFVASTRSPVESPENCLVASLVILVVVVVVLKWSSWLSYCSTTVGGYMLASLLWGPDDQSSVFRVSGSGLS